MTGVSSLVYNSTFDSTRSLVYGAKDDVSMPRQALLGRFPFIGEDGESSWLGSVTLPESYFAVMGVGPFFTDSGVPINVPQVFVEEWIETNGQPPHWWIYRHWLYVYDPYLITDAIADRYARVVRESVLARSGVLHYKIPTKFFNGFDFTGSSYSGGALPELDNTGLLVSPGVNIPSIRGARLAITVADGAVLGQELYNVSTSTTLGLGWTSSGNSIIGNAVTTYSSCNLYKTAKSGIRYKLSFTVTGYSRVGGSNPNVFIGTNGASNDDVGGISANGNYSYEHTIQGLSTIIVGIRCENSTSLNMVVSDISIKEVIPTYYDTDAAGNQLNPSTLQPTRVGNAGLTAFTTGPTFKDYAPSDPANWGWLCAPSRTNYCLYSTDLSQAGWASTGCKAFGSGSIANSSLAPDNTLTADLLVQDSSTGQHFINRLAVAATTDKYTISAYIKPNGCTKVSIQHPGSFSYANASFNLTTCQVITQSNATASIEPAANGFFKCAVSSVATGRYLSDNVTIVMLNDSYNRSFTGDDTSGIYIYNVQLELGAFATSPIPTTSASVTRQGTVLEDPTEGMIMGNNMAFRMIVVPRATGQSTVYLYGTYTDADNYSAIFVSATSITIKNVVSGTPIEATVSYTHVAGTPIEIVAFYSSKGMRLAVRSYSAGTWSAWIVGSLNDAVGAKSSVNVASPYQLGSLNSLNQFYGNIVEFEPLTIPPGTADPMTWAMKAYGVA